ncbi:MAG: FHA domain-containing protein [Lachnospiraceae bacterium]|jgi:hypothetical protein|nr:FHA domain-containing protein [Lachnospiraceae bacterium]
MGKIGRKNLGVMLVLLLCMVCQSRILTLQAAGAEQKTEKLRIEQAHAVMPDIELYCYLDNEGVNEKIEDIEGVYADKELTVVSIKDCKPESGIDYYFLLDVSASISEIYFQSVQQAIIRFQSEMNKKDNLTLLTFGDQVNVVFEKKGAEDDCSGQINSLKNKDMTTALFQAIDQAAAMADTEENARKRSIAIVISDGEDFSTNKTTANEALAILEDTGLPIYSLVAEETNRGEENTYINTFGEFSRQSGGRLATFNDTTAWQSLEGIRNGLYKAKVLTLRADTNHTMQTAQPLTVTVDKKASATINMPSKYSVPDNVSPTASVQEISDREIRITFSEPVIGAALPGNYRITGRDGKPLANYTVARQESSGCEMVLTFSEPFYNGDYEITYLNIYDNSKEANRVNSVNTLTIEDGVKEDTGFAKFFKQYWMILVAVLTVLIVALFFLLFYFRIKRRKGMVVMDGKVMLGNNLEIKQKVELQQKSGHSIVFEINDRAQGKKKIPMSVEESIFVGRSEICDLYFNDEMLSKQHFVIEEGADGFYIQDLGTTNGTMVNGVKIHQRRKLNQEDIINAGMIELKVTW